MKLVIIEKKIRLISQTKYRKSATRFSVLSQTIKQILMVVRNRKIGDYSK